MEKKHIVEILAAGLLWAANAPADKYREAWYACINHKILITHKTGLFFVFSPLCILWLLPTFSRRIYSCNRMAATAE
jgi:hypothetical protein